MNKDWIARVALALALAQITIGLAFVSCTPQQRAIVRTVVDVVEQVCGDGDSVDDCIGKMQAHRDGLKRDGGVDAQR